MEVERAACTHMLEYTPGYRTPSLIPAVGANGLAPNERSPPSNEAAAAGGESHRSGRHSFASAPHISQLRFAARMEMTMWVPSGSATADVDAPECERVGNCKGRVVALVALWNV